MDLTAQIFIGMIIRNNNWATPEVHLSLDALGPFLTGLQSEHMMSYCQDSPGPTLEVVLRLAVQFSIRIMSLQLYTQPLLVWEPPAPLSHSTQSVIRQPDRSVLFYIVLCHYIFTINAIFVMYNTARDSLQKQQNYDELQQM